MVEKNLSLRYLRILLSIAFLASFVYMVTKHRPNQSPNKVFLKYNIGYPMLLKTEAENLDIKLRFKDPVNSQWGEYDFLVKRSVFLDLLHRPEELTIFKNRVHPDLFFRVRPEGGFEYYISFSYSIKSSYIDYGSVKGASTDKEKNKKIFKYFISELIKQHPEAINVIESATRRNLSI